MYSESHCHLRGIDDEVIQKAEKAGVELVLTAGIDMASSVEAVEIARKYDIVKGCIGIHPWYADEYDPEKLEKLRQLAREYEVVAISEIGLDYAGRMTREWVRSNEVIDPEIQRTAFRAQIGLAKELGLPVLVHDRTPDQELLDILEEEGIVKVGAAIHGFTKDKEYAQRAVEIGIYLSIGRGLMREESKELEDAIKQTPLDRLLTETDSGDPAIVVSVAERIAELKGLTKEDFGLATTRNLRKLLNL